MIKHHDHDYSIKKCRSTIFFPRNIEFLFELYDKCSTLLGRVRGISCDSRLERRINETLQREISRFYPKVDPGLYR